MRVSIPLPTACEAVALPCELIPLDISFHTYVPSTHQHIHFYRIKLDNTRLWYTKHIRTTQRHQQTLWIWQSMHSHATFITSYKCSEIASFHATSRLQPLSFTTSFLSYILRIYWLSSVPINLVVPYRDRIATRSSTLGCVPVTNFAKRAFWEILCTLYRKLLLVTLRWRRVVHFVFSKVSANRALSRSKCQTIRLLVISKLPDGIYPARELYRRRYEVFRDLQKILYRHAKYERFGFRVEIWSREFLGAMARPKNPKKYEKGKIQNWLEKSPVLSTYRWATDDKNFGVNNVGNEWYLCERTKIVVRKRVWSVFWW